MKYIFPLFCYLLFMSCSNCKSKDPKQILSNAKTLVKIDTLSTFFDSSQIGVPGKNKVSIQIILLDDSLTKTRVQCYVRKDNQWRLSYLFEDERWSVDILDPEITDFNNDGYKDLKYLKGFGARGGNGIFDLFIFDKRGDSLSYILNSNEYPNLYFNEETKSINAYILSGGNETIFMRIDSMKLKPFASIFQYDKALSVSKYDKQGIEQIIKIDSVHKYEEFAHFTNFDPLKISK